MKRKKYHKMWDEVVRFYKAPINYNKMFETSTKFENYN